MIRTGNNPGASCIKCRHNGVNGLGHLICCAVMPPWTETSSPPIVTWDIHLKDTTGTISDRVAEWCGCFQARMPESEAKWIAYLREVQLARLKHDQRVHPGSRPELRLAFDDLA